MPNLQALEPQGDRSRDGTPSTGDLQPRPEVGIPSSAVNVPKAPGGKRGGGAGAAKVARPRRTAAQQLAIGLSRAVEVGECLEWQGMFSCNGATPVVKVRGEGKSHSDNIAVCRLLWEQENGPVPDGKLVYRKCCNNRCVCKSHLRCGTRQEWKANQKKNGLTKHKVATKLRITASRRKSPDVVNSLEKAREVRSLAGQMSQKQIAAITGVSIPMVSEIICGYAWKETIGSPFAGLGG